MHCLEVEGWTWNEWIAESRRPKKMSPIADGYEDGAAKSFYTTLVQSIPYLRCLITAQEHVDALPSPATSQFIFYEDLLESFHFVEGYICLYFFGLVGF